MAPKATVATLAVQMNAIYDAVLKGQDVSTKALDEFKIDIKADILGITTVTRDHETRLSRGEGALSLLIKLVIVSVVASVGAVIGYVGKQTGLW